MGLGCIKCCICSIPDEPVPQNKPKEIISNDIKENIVTSKKVQKDLIVDDSDPNRIIIKRYLMRTNRIADEAINGEEAIKIIKETGTYNIIWMDVQMPKMNGIKCTDHLRNVLNYKGTIIGLTGHVDLDSVNDCKKAGMQDVLAKPIDKKLLEMYIEKYQK